MTNIPASDEIPEVGGKKVPSVGPSEPKKAEGISGVIGQLEIYRNDAVKIRLANDILLNVISFSTS